jgi:hypothetical protein
VDPALTEANVPEGGNVDPLVFKPQHATAPPVFKPQVWLVPALTETKMPDGAVACPFVFKPQQATVPSVFTPQV